VDGDQGTLRRDAAGGQGEAGGPHFIRGIGLLQATAINMTQMVGIGPFITIPLMVAAFGGPQALIGWVAGAILAMADGLVWAELGAAMPGAGGTYIYLREAFQYWTGKLMPFLFVWTAILSIPLIMSTGVIGLVLYLGYLWPNMSWLEIHAISLVVVGLVVFLLYRRIDSIARITLGLWAVMLLSVALVIVAAFSHFDAGLAFKFPAGAFDINGKFLAGLGAGLLIGIYDYLGYNTTAYMAEEVREPGRVIPRSIIYSVLAIMVVYLVMNIGVQGVVPSDQVAKSSSVASLVLETNWGKTAAQIVTVLILITAFASVFTGLLGGSRVPYNAARDGVFFRQFGRLHPRLDFPHLSVLLMGAITAIGSFFDLSTVLAVIFAVLVLVQAVAQIAALTILRVKQPELQRPYRMWLYPLPSLVAVVGWGYVYYAAGLKPIILSLIWLAIGVVAFLGWARVERTWPFGPNEIHETFVEAKPGTVTEPA
jgi:amino acid transporter